MEREPSDALFAIQSAIEPNCMFCGSHDGHSELVYTGDTESMEGYEVWFCCHPCRDADEACETFHRIVPPNAGHERTDKSYAFAARSMNQF